MVKTIVTQGNRLLLDLLEPVDVGWINSAPHDTNLFNFQLSRTQKAVWRKK